MTLSLHSGRVSVKSKIAAVIAALLLGGIALECAAAPQSQCQDGSTKVQHQNGKTTTYHCSNGEWVKE